LPLLIEPGFDELRTGDLESAPIEAYRSWRNQHTSNDSVPAAKNIEGVAALRERAAASPGEDRNGHARRRSRALPPLHLGGRATGSSPVSGTAFPNAAP
jgi:hypothetical protein